METYLMLEVNCETGESIERPMTADEIAATKALRAEAAASAAEPTREEQVAAAIDVAPDLDALKAALKDALGLTAP